MPLIHLDIETYSEVDLKKCGLYVYAAHPSTEIQVVCWAVDDGPVRRWDKTQADNQQFSMPDYLRTAFNAASDITFAAHNAAFERLLLRHVWGIDIPPERWLCTMVMAYILALPGGLKDVAAALELPEQKGSQRVMIKFAKLRTPSKNNPATRWLPEAAPDDWQELIDYCAQDVETERAVYRTLKPWAPSEAEWSLWHLDQRINDRGLPIDLRLVDQCVGLTEDLNTLRMDESKKITGLANPNSRGQLLPWLATRGYAQEGLTAGEVRQSLADDQMTCHARIVLLNRQQTSKSSTKKFKTIAAATNDDGRLRGMYQFAAAGRTKRWAGRIAQMQNLPRGNVLPRHIDTAISVARTGDVELLDMLYLSPADTLSSLVRPSIAAPEGHSLVCADLTSIESVMLAWASGCETILDLFREGKNSYKDFAAKLFRVSYDQVTKAQRQYCKPPVLGCGYGLGWKGLIAYAEGYGVGMSEQQARDAVNTYRAEYPEVVGFWSECDRAFKRAIKNPGDRFDVGAFRFYQERDFVFITLPSGRDLAYYQPEIQPKQTPWGEMRETVTYMGTHQMTRKWVRLTTHGGKIVENIVQAVARDVLADGLRAAAKAGLDVVGHVHDEIIAQAPEADAPTALGVLIRAMTQSSPWCVDAPLGAGGWVGKHYRKD